MHGLACEQLLAPDAGRVRGVGTDGEWRTGEEGAAERHPVPTAHVGCRSPRHPDGPAGPVREHALVPTGPLRPGFTVLARQTALPWPALSEAL